MEKQHRIEKQRMRKRRNFHDLEKIELTTTGRLLVNAGHGPEDPDVHVCPHLTHILQPHQLGGVRFMYDNIVESLSEFKTSRGFGCILAHSMGLGKTIQVITFVEIFLRVTQAKKVLIIVPVNTIQNWMNEFEKWTPRYLETGGYGRQFEVFLLGDSVKTFDQRVNIIEEWSRRGGVLLVGYEMFRQLIRSTQPKRPSKSFQTKPMESDEKPDDFDQGLTANGRIRKEANEIIRGALVDPGPDMVVCDEGHKIKNLNTDIAAALGAIHTKRRIVLTGYPLQNNLMEYYCMVDFVRPDFLGSKKTFSIQFERPIKNGQCIDSTARDVKIARQRIHVLNNMLKGFIQRRTHHLLKAILPEAKEFVLLLRKSPLQHVLYRNFVMYANAEISSGNSSVFNPLKAFAACSKIWNHPDVLAQTLERKREEKKKSCKNDVSFLLFNGTSVVYVLLNMFIQAEIPMALYRRGNIENGYKMVIAMELLDATVRIGEKMLIFSQNLTALDLIESYLSRRLLKTAAGTTSWMKNINYFRFDGSTSGSERERLISRFNTDASVHLFLISTRAGSLGINLVAANRCIIFDACWNPCHDAQAVCRIYRYGQQRRTYIYRLIMNNCMEKAIFNRQISKHGLQQRVVDDAQVDANITQKELETLLMYDESLDVVSGKWDTSGWNFGDEVLESVVKSRSEMLSILFQRSYCLSEEEKKEAELWFAKEQCNVVRKHIFIHILFGCYVSACSPIGCGMNPAAKNQSQSHHQNPSYVPLRFNCFSVGSAKYHVDRMNDIPIRIPPFPGAAVAYEPSSNSRGSVQLITTDRSLSLPIVSHPSESCEVPANTQALLVRTADGVFLRLNNGLLLDAQNTVFDSCMLIVTSLSLSYKILSPQQVYC
ncbi:unnamed protein product [Angiostrongylus costaricensis]|uniref:Helicase ARIP4 n=1 Tax=Angiostrongylus costaricensis TaxID=334426 RepID=A0A158PIG9_ANGCS|nr:unnamed protein product [Angiostrongylus costaricensis]